MQQPYPSRSPTLQVDRSILERPESNGHLNGHAKPQAPPSAGGADISQKRHLDLPAQVRGNGANGNGLLSRPPPTNGHHNGHTPGPAPAPSLVSDPAAILEETADMPQTTIDQMDPALQTQFRWILSRLDGHDALFKATEAKFDGVDKRLEIVGEGLGTAREERGNLKYRLDEAAALLKKFQEQQEKDALPLIKEIHDTTRLAQELGKDLADVRKEHREGIEQMRISQKEQIDELRKAHDGQMADLKKAIKKVAKAQRGQTQRFMRMAALVLGIGVSLTVVAQFVAQHLVFH